MADPRPGDGGGVGRDAPREGLQGISGTADEHLDFADGVPGPADQPVALRKAEQERAEADPLDLPGDPETAAGTQATSRVRMPFDHQIRQAPSSDTMQGPMGVRGVQAEP
jgi:hypothetical protein